MTDGAVISLPLAEYPGAIWMPAHPSNYETANRPLSSINHLVIHITDGHADPRGTAGMFQTPKEKRNPPIGSSAHFITGQDATILQCVHLKDIAWHAHDANGTSIGLEHSARSPGEFGKTDVGMFVTDVQYAASARLAAYLCRLIGVFPTRTVIQGHIEIDPKTTHEDCPNRIWDWQKYMVLVVGEYQNVPLIC